jgi:poly-gamma-glutamate capsule biosynthesis protein CapA/YwtB (metallophosphatase superfamily)
MNRNENRQSSGKKRRRLKKSARRIIFIGFIALLGIFAYKYFSKPEEAVTQVAEMTKDNKHEGKKDNKQVTSKPTAKKPITHKPAAKTPIKETTIKISAAGDFTLGSDESFAYTGSFLDEADSNGLPYFIGKLNNIFKNDDLSTVNLETTFTKSTQKADKKFRFKGDPSYAKILELAGIESVNIANNHIHDYMEKGYEDTKATLRKQNIGFFGYENQYTTTVKGIKIGALGYEGWDDTSEMRNKVSQDIKGLRDQGVKIILVHYHWGIERSYVPSEPQKTLARYTIDSGADLVLGHHPHVVQGVEEYKGKSIVYSLGNFMFGGNRNPSDKDTFVFQQTFHLKNGELSNEMETEIIPFSISSVNSRNNYQPLLLKGSEAERVKKKITDLSKQIN